METRLSLIKLNFNFSYYNNTNIVLKISILINVSNIIKNFKLIFFVHYNFTTNR